MLAPDALAELLLSLEAMVAVEVAVPRADGPTVVGTLIAARVVPDAIVEVGVRVQETLEEPTVVALQFQPVPVGTALTVTPAGSVSVMVIGCASPGAVALT